MRSTVALDQHAKRIREYLDKAATLRSESEDCRLRAGRELIAARRLVYAGETPHSWPEWCAQSVGRSQRDIRRLIALASADDPMQAREAEKARNRAAKPAGSRASSTWQALDEGAGAFLRGVPQDACPYPEGRRHAAWRKGWAETQHHRTGASPGVVSRVVDAGSHPLGELRRALAKYWPLLSRGDQETLIDWLTDHMIDTAMSPKAREKTSPDILRAAARQAPAR